MFLVNFFCVRILCLDNSEQYTLHYCYRAASRTKARGRYRGGGGGVKGPPKIFSIYISNQKQPSCKKRSAALEKAMVKKDVKSKVAAKKWL